MGEKLHRTQLWKQTSPTDAARVILAACAQASIVHGSAAFPVEQGRDYEDRVEVLHDLRSIGLIDYKITDGVAHPTLCDLFRRFLRDRPSDVAALAQGVDKVDEEAWRGVLDALIHRYFDWVRSLGHEG